MILDLTSLEKALKILKEALAIYEDDRNDDIVRDSCIQRFEYCYALSTKMLRRYLEITSDKKAVIDTSPFPDMIRIAAEKGLVQNSWDVWEKFRKARNQTSHTYNAKIAAEIMAVIPAFYNEAMALLSNMLKGNV